MSNDYYTHTNFPPPNAPGSSAQMRAQFGLVETGFSKLPTLTGNGNKVVAVNPTGTALIATNVLDGVTLTNVSWSNANLTGVPTAPTAVLGTNTSQIATTAFVAQQVFSTTLPGQAGNAGKFLGTDGSNASWVNVISASFQEFTSSGTWTKPAGAQFVMAEAWGAGAGGGSGRRGIATSGIFGGGGGGGGAYTFRIWRASELPSSVLVEVGAGGAGGATVTTNNTDGNDGTPGGNTSFGSFLTAYGGGPGLKGSNVGTAIGGRGGSVLSLTDPAPASGAPGNFGSGSSDSHPSGFGGGNGGSQGGAGGSSYQGGPAGGSGGAYPNVFNTIWGANGGGIFNASGTGAVAGNYPGVAGASGVGRQGGAGGCAGFASNGTARSVAFGNGTFAVVRDDGSILTSSNGTNTWVFVQTPNREVQHIVHDGTQFVLINSGGSRCWTTTNFLTFTERAAPLNVSGSVNALRFVNGNYFLCLGNGLRQSSDLSTWASVATGQSSVNDICWSGANYVAVSGASPVARFSSNLSTWATSTGVTSSSLSCTSNGSGTVVITDGGNATGLVRSTDNGATFSNTVSTLTSWVANLSFVGSTYFYVNSSAQEIWTSTDGSSWTFRAGVPATRNVAFDGTTFVVARNAFGPDVAATAVPASLNTWTTRSNSGLDVAGGAGGNGGSPGGGGGGGGASNNGQNSGAGGAGGNGLCRVYVW